MLEQFSLVPALRGEPGEGQRYRHFSDESQTAGGVIELRFMPDVLIWVLNLGCPMSRFLCET